MIRSQWDKFKQGLNIGFIRADNRLVVDIEECPIAEPALNQQITEVRRHPPPKGGLKLVLRLPPEDWEVPRDSFFQNNFFLLPKLVEVAKERLRDAGTKHLVDVYVELDFSALNWRGWLNRSWVLNWTGSPSRQGARMPLHTECRTASSSPGRLKSSFRHCFSGSARQEQQFCWTRREKAVLVQCSNCWANSSCPGHLCLLPSCDHGTRLEHTVRRGCLYFGASDSTRHVPANPTR